MTLHTIIYVSSAVPKMQAAELDGLLQRAIRFNAQNDITGMLLYRDGDFMQTIEGEKQTLHDLYARILKDKRHQCVITLLDQPLAAREFADWSMGFERIDPLAAGRKTPSDVTARAFTQLQNADTEASGVALRLLTGFFVCPIHLKSA